MVPYVVYSLTYSPREQRQGIRTIRTIHTMDNDYSGVSIESGVSQFKSRPSVRAFR